MAGQVEQEQPKAAFECFNLGAEQPAVLGHAVDHGHPGRRLLCHGDHFCRRGRARLAGHPPLLFLSAPTFEFTVPWGQSGATNDGASHSPTQLQRRRGGPWQPAWPPSSTGRGSSTWHITCSSHFGDAFVRLARQSSGAWLTNRRRRNVESVSASERYPVLSTTPETRIMNVRFLETFVWLAQLRNFRMTAEKLHTTQAAVSSRIATLEQEFGVRLFERGVRDVALTLDGSKALIYAERLVRTMREMRECMADRKLYA